MEERCIAWDPVPPEANRFMILNVVYVEQMALGLGGMPLSLVVVSSSQQGSSDTIRVEAWRITFRNIGALRMMEIDMWPGPRPKESPGTPLKIATWEVAHSRWLETTVSAHYRASHPLHHWVITSSDVLYEVAARDWKSEYLGEWRKGIRDALRERWVQDHGELPEHGL